MSIDPNGRFADIMEFNIGFREALKQPASIKAAAPAVFISYQRAASGGWATHIAKELERTYGCKVFLDTLETDSAGPFPKKIQRKIENCDAFVCLLSESTLDSDWVRREIEHAHKNSKIMIPVFQESFKQPAEYQSLQPHLQYLLESQGVQLFDRRNLYVDATLKELAERIRHPDD